ncbi:ThiF family adenylyltransferase [Chryseobacterium sp. MYb328]|uniref:ThiF family adenylyltransferase n=1 Tax=Chryseobacterium sp. MYb328 TaxID=2745231 RepID=UPI0030AF8E2D
MNKLKHIENFIQRQSDIKILTSFSYNSELKGLIEGSITIEVEPSIILNFEVSIYPLYPFQFQNVESISFKNPELLEYGHIMKDGSICIHTTHSVSLEEKLGYDFNSLRLWIKEYYINSRNSSSKYEHIITPLALFEDCYYSLCFNNIEKDFLKGEFGLISLSEVRSGIYNEKRIRNFYLQSFNNISGKELHNVEWNPKIKSLSKNEGIYVYIENIPAEYGKFSLKKWDQLHPYLSKSFIETLHYWEKNIFGKGEIVPLIVGYKIPNGELHWELIILKAGDFPLYGVKDSTKKWNTEIDGDRTIKWGKTHNISYDYFFGRGKLNDRLTEGKILLLGIGAVGSMIANTLVRGGCKNICIIDFDTKYPENVCRSEYTLNPLVCSKIEDLRGLLYDISPYVHIPALDIELKLLFQNTPEKIREFEEIFNSYDFVFDCTTDNDLLYLISKLNLTSDLFSFSISNKADHLVCACDGNRYLFSRTQFNNVLKYNTEDLYEPTGCWSPTFKASYNDINLLVQTAIKHINLKLEKNIAIGNFVVETEFEDNLKIALNEF